MAEEIGVNLLENSSFEQGLTGWNVFTAEGSTREVVQGPRGQKALKLSRDGYTGGLRTGVHRWPTFNSIEAGEELTISAWIRVDEKPDDFDRNAIFLRNSTYSDNPIISIPKDAEVGKWVKYSKSLKFEKASNVNSTAFHVLLGTNGAFSVSEIKLERGGVPTEWTPAPEDPKPMVIARSDEITVVRVNDGAKGETGATGKGVKAITPQYYLSTSNTSCTGGTWQNTEPEYVSGRYYWTRSKIVWTDGSTTYTSAVLAEGVNNANQSAESANETANSAQDTANDAQNTANNAAADAEAAQSAAENAQQTADNAQQAAENANAVAGEAHQAALEAQAASDKANELASGATAGLQQISQVFYADSTGAHVKAANDNETVIQSDGMHVMVGDDEVARFTKDDSHVDNLAVGRFLMFGAHRAEVYEDGGEVGTGFFWVGDVK